MITFYDFGSVAPITEAIVVQDFATGTTTGSPISHPATGLGSLTPDAALVFAGRHVIATGSAEQAGASLGVGFIGDSVKAVAAITSDDNVASTNTTARRVTNGSYLLSDADGSASLVPGGLEITYGAAPSSRRGVYVAFAGFDVDHQAADMGTGTTAVTWTTGFEADVVFVLNCASTSFGSGTNNNSSISFGIATKDGTQRCVVTNEQDNAAAGAPRTAILTDCVGSHISPTTGAQSWKLTAGGFGATSYTITPSANTGGLDVVSLSVGLNGRQAKIVDFTTPTSTGTQSITGAGFTPSFALIVLTNLETVPSTFAVATSDLCSGLSICCVDASQQWAHSYRADSGADPTDTASFTGNYAVIGASATDARAILATLVGFTSDGMDLSYSAVQGTGKKGFILFIE